MKFLFSLNHPAHYYLFKYIIQGLKKNGHKTIIVIRQKDVLEKVLRLEEQNYIKINEKKKRNKNAFSIVSKGISELIKQDINLFKIVNKYKPDFLLGTDISITHIGSIIKTPSFVFNEDDYEINRMFCVSSYPFASYIVAPEYTSVGPFLQKKIAYNGIQKMAYLNPNYFKPDERVLSDLGIKRDERFFLIRLVSLTSGHDIEGKHNGIDEQTLNRIIHKLEPFGRIFITSEDNLSQELLKYQVKVQLNKIQDLMYYAQLFIGDSQTMCAEAGILGTPFIRFNDFVGKIEYLNDIENNYNLGWGVKTNQPEKLFEILDEVLKMKNIKEIWREKSKKLFHDKVDLTGLTLWMLENYPESITILKQNPDYQYNFK